MTKRLILLLVIIIILVALIWVAQNRVAHNLQEQIRVSADLRRAGVEKDAIIEAYEELFNCFTLKDELGLIEEDTNE